MSAKIFILSDAFKQYARGLARLHELIAANRDDSPEGDELRDSLDGPWRLLTDEEIKRIDGLAEDLNRLLRPEKPPKPMNPQVQRKLAEADDATRRGEWDRALEILRRWQKYLPPAFLSYLRGTIWYQAGDSATAALFFKHAADLDPSDGTYKALYLHALGDSDTSEALRRAHEIVNAVEENAPEVLYQAAFLKILSAQTIENSEAREVYRNTIPALMKVLEAVQTKTIPLSLIDRRYGTVYSLLSLCHDKLGEPKLAMDYLDKGLSVDPDDAFLLLWRGIRRYGIDPNAIEDFKRIVRTGSKNVWPHYFLAHHAIVNGQYQECLEVCDRALQLDAPDVVRGDLNAWLAIARAELGFPKQSVRSAFEEAIRIAPDSDRIRRNFQVWEAEANASPGGSRKWEMPRESVVQEMVRANCPPLAA